ncbi:MAG: ABC transporter substrate-binding protein [Methylocystis sp.]|nr:ABC transporter substrate-binding protein [Methylocystis sp.]MCA3583901.1 ABC transporter substrate-binding protein [Methylocystis sp.]MCA3588444.1 ABC transporter substrate-binding protein [Methylocystis sp.]MCA3592405.1 ABC transporter substrate-binding protein [Methylocystis sp.]
MIRMTMTALLLATGAMAASAQTNLRIGLAEDPDALDPTTARTYVGRIVFASICDKLFDIDDKLNVVPQLALSHETSADGKAVTIKLRPGVKFHDGEPMDAEAVKFSLDRHMTMQGSFRRPELSIVDKVVVIDPLTVRLELKSPFAPLIAQLTDRSGMMVSPKAAREAGDRFALKPVCAGPYQFVERVQQDRIVVQKFADYWDKDNVHIDRITYLPIVDSTVRLANLRSGQLDLIERALATDIKEIRANNRLKLVTAPELGYQGMTINVGKGEASKVFADKRIRMALAASIDRAAINQVVFNGEFTPGNQWVGPTNPYFQQKFPVPGRDIARAKRLIAEAGVKTPIPIDFMVPQGPETRQVAEVIQAMAAEAGFDMKIRVTEFATSLTEAEAGRYQAFILAWSGRTDPDGNIYSFAKTGQPNNYGGFSDPEVDAWLDEARTRGAPAERKAIYEKAAAKLIDEGGIIYLYHRLVIIAHSTRLTGFTQLPDGLVRVKGMKLN